MTAAVGRCHTLALLFMSRFAFRVQRLVCTCSILGCAPGHWNGDGAMTKSTLALFLIIGMVALGGAAARSQPPKEPPSPPGPGMVIPPFVREGLQLSQQQERQVATLEQDVKVRLKKILTDIQMGLFEESMRQGPG